MEKAQVCLTGTVQSREVRNEEENIYECNIWQGEKLRFLPCWPEELCGVSKGSSTPEEPQRTLDSLQTGKSRRKQMIWYIWWYFPCLKSAEGEAPESFTQPTTWTSGRKCSPFTLSNTPYEQVTFWALWTLFMPQKKSEKFCFESIQILYPNFEKFCSINHRPPHLSVLKVLGSLLWLLGYSGGKTNLCAALRELLTVW